MNEERTGKCLRQVEHIRGHLQYNTGLTVYLIRDKSIILDRGRHSRIQHSNDLHVS
jgi:hypothetical protein